MDLVDLFIKMSMFKLNAILGSLKMEDLKGNLSDSVWLQIKTTLLCQKRKELLKLLMSKASKKKISIESKLKK